MSVINRARGYLFLCEPHCASRSVTAELMKHEGSQLVGQHETYSRMLETGAIDESDSLLKFCVVRHPADWLVTRYHHMTSWHGKGFRAFLRYLIDNDQLKDIIYTHPPSCNRLIRYETLEADLNHILRRFGVLPEVLLTIGQTKGKGHWRESYEAEDLDALRGYLNGIQTYGYTL